MRYLILGCGPAGIAAAKAIRGKDKKGEIVIATEERVGPYLRPLLTDLLAGRQEPSALADPQAAHLAENRIEVLRGKRATSVDCARNRVVFSDGTEEGYDALLIATGGKPAVPPQLSIDRPSIFPFDSLDDALRIMERIPRSGTVAVYGPGFLAIVASSALRKRGNEVVWFQPDLPRSGYPIGGELEANILDSVRNTGVKILDGHDIAEIREIAGGIEAASTVEGDPVRCAAIVVATERSPAIGFLAGSGVETGAGILVDDRLRTNLPNIYAAGDCAELFDWESGQSRINFGWRSAGRQGQLAGENMAGAEKFYVRDASDYFWVLFGPALLDRIK
ncbi:MAG: FAD-dependent oxidoreductase [Deltaproteobacteria bacterium]|nr:FAD-dependent oxidoreductase [Deltaproteobacteria bacterium]